MEGSRQPGLATTESFSYSWLPVGNCPKPHQIHQEDEEEEEFMFSNINDDHGGLSLEIDRYPSFSTRRINRIHDDDEVEVHHHEAAAAEKLNFSVFSTIAAAGHPSFSDANTLYSNGLIMREANNNNNNNCTISTPTGTIASTTTTSHNHHQNSSSGSSSSPVSSPPTLITVPNYSFRNLRKSPRKTLRKYLLGFLNPSSCKKGSAAGCSRRSIRVDDLDKRVEEVHKSWRMASNYYTVPSATELGIISSPAISRATSMGVPEGSDTESPIYEAIMYCKRSSSAN